MELTNPCINCDWHRNGGHKNSQRCRDCQGRIDYVKAMGGLSESLPEGVDLDCGNGGPGIPNVIEKADPGPGPAVMETVKEICERNGVNFRDVRDKSKRQRIGVRTVIREIITVLSDDYKLNNSAIAKVLGVTNSAVWQQKIAMDEEKKGVKKAKRQKAKKAAPPEKVVAGIKDQLKIDVTPIYEKIVVVDFTSHPELYDGLLKISADQLRSPEDQVKFIVKCYLS